MKKQSDKAKKKYRLRVIGRRENVSFPEWALFNIEGKIDTGAYTSALHCSFIEEKDGILCFTPLFPNHPAFTGQSHRTSTYTKKLIKNSSGDSEERYIVRTLIHLGRKKIRCRISLTNRAGMRYPLLIGRRMLKNKFIIDISKTHTGGNIVLKRPSSP